MELVRYIFIIPGVNSFLSQRVCQDALEQFIGSQRQRRGTHDDPNVLEFMKNTQGLRVVNSIVKPPKSGNCHDRKQDVDIPVSKENSMPLPIHPHKTIK